MWALEQMKRGYGRRNKNNTNKCVYYVILVLNADWWMVARSVLGSVADWLSLILGYDVPIA